MLKNSEDQLVEKWKHTHRHRHGHRHRRTHARTRTHAHAHISGVALKWNISVPGRTTWRHNDIVGPSLRHGVQKYEKTLIFSIFWDFSAAAISSGSEKCHLEELSSDLTKKARIPRLPYLTCRNQIFPGQYFQNRVLFLNKFFTFCNPRVFSR